MEDDIRKLMVTDIAFHRTSTRQISLKSVPPPLEIITTVCQVQGSASYPPLKAACMMAMNFSQFPGFGNSSLVAAQIQILRCLALMLDGPQAQCSSSCSTTSEISSSAGILSSTGKGATSMGIGCPGGRTWAYISKRSTVRVSSDIRAKGEGLLDASLYHPHIRNHASLTRGGSDARRD